VDSRRVVLTRLSDRGGVFYQELDQNLVVIEVPDAWSEELIEGFCADLTALWTKGMYTEFNALIELAPRRTATLVTYRPTELALKEASSEQ
jgi:hypothetical protein